MTIPKVIEEVGFDFDWEPQEVWALDYPTEVMELQRLAWHFDLPFWNDGEKWYALKPIDVANFPEQYAKEYERTMQADLAYPIDIMENKGRYVILDGLHRLLKAKLLGLERVDVRVIPRSEIPNLSKS
ncbi:ParB/RepB/Spo0J family partition protein [Lactococcus allomyrinae]|uniref:Uncharacterized protein n=1 Tax=Lactococcus allomyrinae TaxID=2419773 RepID=A0A387BND2_9LACT|nr:ParB/RepB/Spo0J family partition protein [Lactococcus allomyrinae]AYG00031.1 hypothetical protein D7I46_02355 [Lactococcus allomyrinae]